MKVQCVKCGRQYFTDDSNTGKWLNCECGYSWILGTKEQEETFVKTSNTFKHQINELNKIQKKSKKQSEQYGCIATFWGIIAFLIILFYFLKNI